MKTRRLLRLIATLLHLAIIFLIASIRISLSTLTLRLRLWRHKRRLRGKLVKAGLPRKLADDISSDYAERMMKMSNPLSINFLRRVLREARGH